MKRVPLTSLHALADHRPEGYLLELLSAGKLVGQPPHEIVEFEDEIFAALTDKFTPSLPERGKSVFTAFARWASEGFPVLPQADYFARESVCLDCPFYTRTRTRHHCALCGCDEVKLWLPTEQCPDDPPRWLRALPAAPPP